MPRLHIDDVLLPTQQIADNKSTTLCIGPRANFVLQQASFHVIDVNWTPEVVTVHDEVPAIARLEEPSVSARSKGTDVDHLSALPAAHVPESYAVITGDRHQLLGESAEQQVVHHLQYRGHSDILSWLKCCWDEKSIYTPSID